MTDNGNFGFGVGFQADAQIAGELVALLIDAGVLTFGEFTLKSGRVSPYFMNFGKACSGKVSRLLGEYYAGRIAHESHLEFDVVFGPAYKGIALASQTAGALAMHGHNVDWAYNRKEAKDHGEGGTIVGPNLIGRKVVIVDDVITAGTALGEAVEIIRKAGGIPVGAVLAFDRAEKGKDGELSAVQEAREKYGFPVFAIATLDDLLACFEKAPVQNADDEPGELFERIKDYRAKYGAVDPQRNPS